MEQLKYKDNEKIAKDEWAGKWRIIPKTSFQKLKIPFVNTSTYSLWRNCNTFAPFAVFQPSFIGCPS
jgi:hypothetical protein